MKSYTNWDHANHRESNHCESAVIRLRLILTVLFIGEGKGFRGLFPPRSSRGRTTDM